MKSKYYILTVLMIILSLQSATFASPDKKNKGTKKESVSKTRTQEGDLTKNEGTITLISSGEGQSIEDATKNALRSAIEQAFGAFVSAKTEVVNDEIVKDEIATISSGNIQGYKVISTIDRTTSKEVSVEAVVSINKLISFAQNKGMSTELSGASYAMNKRMRDLNKENEIRSFEHLRDQLVEIAKKGCFDYKIQINDPQEDPNSGTINVPIIIDVLSNQNFVSYNEILYNFLKSISMSQNEISEYKKNNIPIYVLVHGQIITEEEYKHRWGSGGSDSNERAVDEFRKYNTVGRRGEPYRIDYPIYLRAMNNMQFFLEEGDMLDKYIFQGFVVKDDIGKIIEPYKYLCLWQIDLSNEDQFALEHKHKEKVKIYREDYSTLVIYPFHYYNGRIYERGGFRRRNLYYGIHHINKAGEKVARIEFSIKYQTEEIEKINKIEIKPIKNKKFSDSFSNASFH